MLSQHQLCSNGIQRIFNPFYKLLLVFAFYDNIAIHHRLSLRCIFPLSPFDTLVYRFLLPVPSLLGARQEKVWLSCPTVQETASSSRTPSGEMGIKEERCHFPFWYNGRLRYECVQLDSTPTSSQVKAFIVITSPMPLP